MMQLPGRLQGRKPFRTPAAAWALLPPAHPRLPPSPDRIRRRLKPPAPHASASSTPPHASSAPLRVCVVGGGVAGLASALRLLHLAHGISPAYSDTPAPNSPPASALSRRPVEVTVVAGAYGSETTTAGAAGLWGPYKLSDTPEARVAAWGGATYEHLMGLVHSPEAEAAGVSLCTVNSFFDEPGELPFWHRITYNFRAMDPRMLDTMNRAAAASPTATAAAAAASAAAEAAAVGAQPPPAPGTAAAAPSGPGRYAWGHTHTSVVCEGARYLPWLERQILALGGRLERRRLGSLGELAGYDAVVNCCGLGAAQLVGDPRVYPIRGQVLRVRAPWVTQSYQYGPYYIIPNRDSVVLGGTGQVGDPSTAPSAPDRAAILAGCTALLPSLAAATPLADWVGLRPGRTEVRLELGSAVLGDGRDVPVVHNYGHGGAGLTLGWGCAGEAAALLAEGVA